MKTQVVGINKSFFYSFVTFNFFDNFGENFMLIFSERKRREFLFTSFERKEKRETRIIKKDAFDYSLDKKV